tara:strand:+ start:1913 stop:2554 length:642 start_codon:yes stop_codon:yes gene_type:complete
MDRLDQISSFNRFAQVSRETIKTLVKFESLLIKANKSLNLIGKSTINQIWQRHILDSFQVIDFIEDNDKTLIDIGSGAGFPGLVIAIAAKDRKIPLKISLIDKSSKKTKFLKEAISELDLNVEVICQNILQIDKKIMKHVFVARAFKPLPKILELIHNQAQDWKKIIIFLGKTGKNELLQVSKKWDIEYKQRVSVTNNDSLVININKVKKKIE